MANLTPVRGEVEADSGKAWDDFFSEIWRILKATKPMSYMELKPCLVNLY